MRDYSSVSDFRPSLIGTMSTIGGTAVGIPIDCLGFADITFLVTAGGLVGSGGAGVFLDVKIQESASATGTGASWTDIGNGVVNGTLSITQMSIGHGVDAGTWIPYQAAKISDYVGGKDANRSRYLRAHATLSGTIGLGPKICVSALLGRPNDTLYIQNAVTFASTNSQLTKLL